jgi:hypothetical protein
MSSYRRGYGRRTYAPTVGRIAKPNARPGPCRACGAEIPAGAGQLWHEESGAWSVVHEPTTWAGSPVSGQYVGGCPADTDALNASGRFGGSEGPQLESERLALVAATAAAVGVRRAGGYRPAYRRGRCEDAPCCGCCD